MKYGLCLAFVSIGLLVLASGNVSGQQTPPPRPTATAEDIEFFEKKVRPLLAENCVSCHSGNQPLGKLRLDPILDIRKGGAKGPVLVPGDPEKSRLISAVRQLPGIAAMPPSGHLNEAQIAILVDWVKRGAPLPASAPVKATPQRDFPLAERRQHWAYQPVSHPTIPVVKNKSVVRNPIDAFIEAKRAQNGLTTAPPADKRTLLRRVTYDLIGLPPTPPAIETFLADTSPNAYEKVVDRLLASPQYGERWGRHWLDLVRYADSMGHEFDYSIFNAYQYRDYVIRALNSDVPYNRFVMEHLAGDLLPQPRRDPQTGRDESILGTGFFWLGEGKHSPVDLRQEQADHVDNQIDVLGKAFLAQTVSCARCHDHKFDPIPTRDYYALYGILKSSRYQQVPLDPPTEAIQALRTTRGAIDRKTVAQAWRQSLGKLSDADLRTLTASVSQENRFPTSVMPLRTWKATGTAFDSLGQPGDLVLASGTPPTLLARPTGHSGLLSPRLEGALRSPTFTLTDDYLHLRVAGRGGRVLLVIDNFLLIRDPLYGQLNRGVDSPAFTWMTMDVRAWKGHRAYIECLDSPIPTPAGSDSPDLPPEASQPDTHWVAMTDAIASSSEAPPTMPPLPPLTRELLLATLVHWEQGTLSPADTDALTVWNQLLQAGKLEASLLQGTLTRMAEIDATIPAFAHAPAICDGTGEDETIFVRGSYKIPGERAARLRLAVCFTEAKTVPAPTGSGRLELARWIASPTHPLTARVIVNRLWKQHFGTGIVPTPDDFGHMGEKPTHPELLDWLTTNFIQQGWSLKKLHRLMVTSATYRMSSRATDPLSERKDPRNALLHRMPVRRLEAEAVRDALLATSGRLDRTMYGPSIYPSLSSGQEGRGLPPQGPLDGQGRRTVYLALRRNFLPSFLMAFDFPTPFTTIGRRSVSNVPAQALTLMNSDLVWEQAGVWAKRLQKEMPGAPASQRIGYLYETAFGRPPLPEEQQALVQYVNGRDDVTAWTEVCHALYNAKEFIYVF